MKRIFISIGLLMFPGLVGAQETYSLAATAQQVSDLTIVVAIENERTCIRLGQAASCTQAQACTAANAAGGASCTAAQARAATARIWPATQAGREEFVTFAIAAPRFQDLKAGTIGRHREKMCEAWTAANQAGKDSMCTATGNSAGCTLCP